MAERAPGLGAGLAGLLVLVGAAGGAAPGASLGYLGGGATGVRAECALIITEPDRLDEIGRVLAAHPGATICVRRFVAGDGAGAGAGVGAGVGAGSTGRPTGSRGGASKQVKLHTTGYSYQDNQGGDNAVISCGVIHKSAGGQGTYDDPTTVAVPGHAGSGTETPCGTRFYVPTYKKYFIVEDTGATKYDDAPHIDIYVDGKDGSKDASYKCQEAVTTEDGSPVDAIMNPPPGEPVTPGPIAQGGTCHLN